MAISTSINLLGYDVFSGDVALLENDSSGIVNTINPHSYIKASKDRLFFKALKSSDILLPDGIGIVLAAKFICGKKISKIAGSDIHSVLINKLQSKGGSCFYLGSSRETLEKIRKRNSIENPNIRVGGFSPPFKKVFSIADNRLMINAINKFNPDVLFVGLTAPKQEKWVYENKEQINAPIICCIGAVFDFYAGTVKRPGKFWISAGLEWLPRLLKEPRRLWQRTFISTPLFIWTVLLHKFGIKSHQNIN